MAGIGEDAIAYQMKDQIMIQSVDVITPVVDDPYQFGAIATANSLSDIYAKGGVPLFALNLIGFPTNSLPLSYLEEIIRGCVDKANEAGISIVGGHTMDDLSPKCGLSVTGHIPQGSSFISKSGATVGDVVLLTKPLGIGIYTTAIDKNMLTGQQIDEVVEWMMKLNKVASEVMRQVTVHASTDVTGFGLIGHLIEIAGQSDVSIEVYSNRVPFLKDALDLARQGAISQGTQNNLFSYKNRVQYDKEISKELEYVFYDPQTSGGLLLIVPPSQVEDVKKEFEKRNEYVTPIGIIKEKYEFSIHIKEAK